MTFANSSKSIQALHPHAAVVVEAPSFEIAQAGHKGDFFSFQFFQFSGFSFQGHESIMPGLVTGWEQ